jgi:hypothetical protein
LRSRVTLSVPDKQIRDVYTDNGTRMIMVVWLRQLDSFTKVDQSWYIAEHPTILEWSETRPLGPPTAG